jgi:hypothetical protein
MSMSVATIEVSHQRTQIGLQLCVGITVHEVQSLLQVML